MTVGTAESCTGGLVTALLTALPGSSAVVERGYVTYANEAKAEALGVPLALIQSVGAVSPEVCEAMVRGLLDHSPVDLGVSITGVAGPGGGTAAKPVGLVYIGVLRRGGEPIITRNRFEGDRQAVRLASVARAVELLKEISSP